MNSIYREPSGRSLSRKNLVFAMRNQDGGGHYDPYLDDDIYAGMSRRNGIKITAGSEEGALEWSVKPHHATMRQIAWEILQTAKDAKRDASPEPSLNN